MSASSNDPPRAAQSPERRSFLTAFGALGFGTLVGVFPFAAGWRAVTSPLRSGGGGTSNAGDDENFVSICPLESVPADGNPRPFVVLADTSDAWTREPNQRIGEVYLSRTDKNGKPEVTAFTAACPHLGCAVEFEDAKGQFECPCHASGFAKDGKKLFGPSLRGLDSLDVKLQGDKGAEEVWVRFERFRAGIAEKEPIA